MTYYKQRGDGFRDEVAALLRLAGFEAETEVRANHTKADVVSFLQRDPFRGNTRIFLEAKYTDGNLGVDTAAQFIGKYSSLVTRRECDEAWLISRHPLTPDAKAAINGHSGLRGMDLLTFQSGLMDFGSYLRDLLSNFEASGIKEYYVPPRDRSGQPLEERLRVWLTKPTSEAPPIAIIGRYGIGKSTFARFISARMANEVQENPYNRIPILIPLGEVFDDQSLEGLLGKTLTGRTRVGNYNFGLFEQLNADGRFVIIFDGFDEMKHGLTLARFERNMRELLRLDVGNAKLVFLGRDTAFHSTEEFERLVLGRQQTGAGALVPTRDRRSLEPIHVEDFRPEDVRSFVSRYLPLRARQEARGACETSWMEARVKEVLSGQFDILLARPVHAQMLCDIAARPNADLSGLTKHGLYDQFVHYLLDREVIKRDFAVPIGIEIRRRFNAMVAWWLWCQDQGISTRLEDIPQSLVERAAGQTVTELQGEELRRALVIGCLVEKGGDHFYFSHRSVQEFLVAEHLAETDLLSLDVAADVGDRLRLLALVTPDIQDFLTQRISMPKGQEMATRWLKALPVLQNFDMQPNNLGLFVKAYEAVPAGSTTAWSGESWAVFLKYFSIKKEVSFIPKNQPSFKFLKDVRNILRGRNSDALHAAALLLLARVFRSTGGDDPNDLADIIAAWLPVEVLRDNAKARIYDVQERPGIMIQFRKSDDFRLWAFLRAVSSRRGSDGSLILNVDLRKLEIDMSTQLGFGFARSENPIAVYGVSSSLVFQAMGRLGMRDFEMEPVRRFWNVAGGFSSRFQALEIEGRVLPPETSGWDPRSYQDSKGIGRRRRS